MEKPINYLDESNVEYAIDLAKYYYQAMKNSLSEGKVSVKENIKNIGQGQPKDKYIVFKTIAISVAAGFILGSGTGIMLSHAQDNEAVAEAEEQIIVEDPKEKTQPIVTINDDLIGWAKDKKDISLDALDAELAKTAMMNPDQLKQSYETVAYIRDDIPDTLEEYLYNRGYKSTNDWLKTYHEKLADEETKIKEEEYKTADKAKGL